MSLQRLSFRTLALFGMVVSVTPAQGQTIWYVDDGNCPGPGTGGEADPFCTIQSGIDAAADGDTVLAAGGVYEGDGNKSLDFGGGLITLRCKDGAGACVIDCAYDGRGFIFQSGETASAVLDGFVVTRGGVDYPEVGGGILIVGSAPTITNCTFHMNHAGEGGGLAIIDGGNPTVTGCTFSENTGGFGGGMHIGWDCGATVSKCLFIDNDAGRGGGLATKGDTHVIVDECMFTWNSAIFGGGMLIDWSEDTLVTGCVFRDNYAYAGGGITTRLSTTAEIVNCLFYQNTADFGAAMASDIFSYPTVAHGTFVQNSATKLGGALANFVDSATALRNCVLWDNGPNPISGDEGSFTIAFSDVQGGWAGEGNIDEDPLFVPGPLGCHYLSQTAAGEPADSPCVDAGDPLSEPVDGTTRSDEAADKGFVDMGFHPPVSGLPLMMGDFERDGDVDFVDVRELQLCFTGEGPADVPPCCRIFDFEFDGDVDLDDYGAFLAVFTGP